MVISIIIVNYNGKRFFDACLNSIDKFVPFEHEVIVVDNASIDGSADYIRKNFPKVKLIESGSNVGFAGGNNLGAENAKGKFLLLLNNDTILLNTLAPILELMEREVSIGILGARMLGKDREYRYSAGYFPEPWRLIKLSSLYRKDNGFRNGVFQKGVGGVQVDWIEGSFLLTPSDVWHDLGGLDESYFMYVEDIDYAKKVADSGRLVIYFPDISYMHFGGYGDSRIGMLFSGLRNYHKAHSAWGKRVIVNMILDAGLLVRVLAYYLRSIGNKHEKVRAVNCLKALRRMN